MSAEVPLASDLIRQVKFLGQLTGENLAKVAGIGTVEHRSPGTVLFQEGTVCENLFFVMSGRVALEMQVPRRGPVRILTVGPGEVLAWSALLSDERMTATGTVLGETTLVSIPGRKLLELCNADCDIGYAVMHGMAVALSRRLVATRLQLLDVFAETESA